MELIRRLAKFLLFSSLPLLLWCVWNIELVRAQTVNNGGQVSLTAEAGFDGYVKNKSWIPVKVQVENNGPDLEGAIVVPVEQYNNRITRYSYPISLPSVSRKEITLFVYSEDFYARNDMNVLLISGNDEVARTDVRLTPLGQEDLLFGVLSDYPSDFNFLADLDPINGNALVAQLETSDIPDKFSALKSLDTLLVSNSDTGKLSASQSTALANWISAGGHLIVTGGPNWDKTAAGLAGLLPFTPDGSQTPEDPGLLLSTSGGDQVPVGNTLISTGSASAQSRILMSLGDLPLIIRQSYGEGQLDYLTMDPSLLPLKGWSGTSDLFKVMVSKESEQPGLAAEIKDWYSASNAISTLPGLEILPIWMLCGFLGIYILAVGPLNLFVLHRMKRRELAWLSIPGLVIIFSGVAYLAGSLARGNQPVLNRLAIVQAWPEARTAQVNGLIGIFSPGRATYRLSLEGDDLAHPFPIDSNVSGREWEIQYHVDEILVPGIRVEVGGLQAISVENSMRAPAFSDDLKVQIDADQVRLSGSISNDSDLILKDAVLLASGNSHRIGDFSPGSRQEVQIEIKAAGQTAGVKTFYGPAPYTNPNLSSVYYPYSNANDTALVSILGTTDFFKDQETQRRYNLVMAMLNSETGISGLGDGVYLAGWTDNSPLSASISEKFQTSDLTLYLIHMSPDVEIEENAVALPPPVFSWASLSPGSSDINAPYGSWLYTGSYSVMFKLAYPVDYSSVKSLTLHLKSYNSTGTSDLLVFLWDFEQQAWITIPDTSWGDHEVTDPGRYVGPGGEIRMRLQNDQNPSGIQIEAADFTMTVER